MVLKILSVYSSCNAGSSSKAKGRFQIPFVKNGTWRPHVLESIHVFDFVMEGQDMGTFKIYRVIGLDDLS